MHFVCFQGFLVQMIFQVANEYERHLQAHSFFNWRGNLCPTCIYPDWGELKSLHIWTYLKSRWKFGFKIAVWNTRRMDRKRNTRNVDACASAEVDIKISMNMIANQKATAMNIVLPSTFLSRSHTPPNQWDKSNWKIFHLCNNYKLLWDYFMIQFLKRNVLKIYFLTPVNISIRYVPVHVFFYL